MTLLATLSYTIGLKHFSICISIFEWSFINIIIFVAGSCEYGVL